MQVPLIPPPGAGREERSQLAPRNNSFDCEDRLTLCLWLQACPQAEQVSTYVAPFLLLSPTCHLIHDILLSGARPDGDVSNEPRWCHFSLLKTFSGSPAPCDGCLNPSFEHSRPSGIWASFSSPANSPCTLCHSSNLKRSVF